MDNFIGEIRLFAGSYVPEYWLRCDGSQMLISQYNAAFALLGTRYGGNGTTNFAIPNLNGRVPIHMGQGTNLTNRPLAGVGGSETISLSISEIPLHTHTMYATSAAASSETPNSSELGVVAGAGSQFVTNNTNMKLQPMSQLMISTAGGGAAHNNLMPSMALNYIIALDGLFPTQN